MGLYRNSKKPSGRNKAVKGGFPSLNPVPGDGDIVKPAGELSVASAAHCADDSEIAFGVGKAKQRSASLNRGRPSGSNV
jgi:hypothetical protein